MQEKAAEIVARVGGEGNVKLAAHCMTRLRFTLNDEGKVDLEALKRLEGVMGVVQQGGQTQIIIGSDVPQVFNALTKQFPGLAAMGGGAGAAEKGKKQSVVNRVLDALSSILVSALPPIIGGGMIKGFMFLFTSIGWIDGKGDTAMLLNLAGDTMFYFFPFLLAVSSAKKFKTNEYMALSLAGVLMYPSIIKMATDHTVVKFLGLIPIFPQSYASSVLPIILTVWLFSYLYRFLEDHLPSVVSVIFTPLLSMVIATPIMLGCVAPIGFFIGQYIALGIEFLINACPPLAGFVVGATRPLLVLTGMHHAIRPIVMQQFASFGYSTIGEMNYFSTMAQASTVFAIWFVAKSRKLKQVSSASAISGYIGITEPALYSVIVKYRASMIGVLVGGGIGGMFSAIFGLASLAMAMPSVLSIPVFMGDKVVPFFLTLIITIASTFVITVVMAKGPFKLDESVFAEGSVLGAPVAGEVVDTKAVKDETFSGEMLGKTLAFKASLGTVFAPADGTVDSFAEAKHAVQFITADGAELLIHVGINTVELAGKHFTPLVQDGQKVKKGTPLLDFDQGAIEAAGFDTTVVMIIVNSGDYEKVTVTGTGAVAAGDAVLDIA
jgi:PTS system beta-glucosides-specific IIC component